MIMIRSPSFSRSASGMFRRLSSGDPAEDRSDGHPETGQIALPEDVPCHDLARGVEVLRWLAGFQEYARVAVHFHAQIRESDPGAERIGAEGRLVYRHRPVALGRVEAFRRAGVEH